ncbi:glycosyltransferase family 1 protein [Bdellovibrio sp. ZAP7]|uniref:glycosyltransferase family 4 protein n=1 Tax=Bdellovibrio sp. ZAP7 TaxID=2231053 RepID=UPI00143DFB33|nr:glycosyltransferase family 1 protein [Bdellovibrio sp. ZAP7]
MDSQTANTLHQAPRTVFFDVSTLNPDKVTGIGVYMNQLWQHLKDHPKVKFIPVIKLSRLKNRKKLEAYLGRKIQPLWPWTGIATKNAVYHGPDFKISMGSSIPKVVTIHDMVVFEKSYNTSAFYNKGIDDLTAVLKSDLSAVIVNSEFTKQEVLKYFPELASKTYVTYLGCDRSYPLPEKIASLSTEKYILFLGTLEKRKNVTAVLEAFKILCQKGTDHKLVLAGTWGFGDDEIKAAIAKFPFPEKLVHLSYVPNTQIEELFKKATAFVFPSLYEGFGIPVLEAMSLGCPVVTSNEGVLKEVTGEAALHASPHSPQEIAEKLEQLIHSEELRSKMIKLGKEHSRRFTWKTCAEETLKVYQKI